MPSSETWVPVTKSSPQALERVLVWSGFPRSQVMVAQRKPNGNFSSIPGCWEVENVTHWMPLPKGPNHAE